MSPLPKLLVPLLLSLALAGCARAPAPAPATPSAAPAEAPVSGAESAEAPPAGSPANPILFVVRNEGARSFLFGTIHAGVSAERALGEPGLSLVTRARLLLTELPAELDAMALLGAMLLPEGESLRGHIGEERFQALAARIQEAPPAVVDRLVPWAAMLQAGAEDMKRVSKARGGDANAAMDSELQALAEKHGVPNEGLETVGDQIAIFTGIAPELLLELIDEALTDEGQSMVGQLYDAYLRGDTDALLTLTEEENLKEDAPELYEALLPARNKAWMKRLEVEMKKGGVFVAVGAAHLLGEDGLLDLLREAGFEVERATPDDY